MFKERYARKLTQHGLHHLGTKHLKCQMEPQLAEETEGVDCDEH